jgi:diaminopimelate decarboxylase
MSCLPRIDAGTGSPVGVDAGRVLTSPAGFASRANARVVGLRLCFAEDDLAERVAEAVRATCALATALHVRVESLDLCGFDVPLPALAGLRTRLTELLAGEPTRLMFEAGRQLVGSAGTLVTAVLDVREVPGGQVVVLESGANHVGPFAGGRRRSLVPRLLSRTADPAELLGTTVVGPLEIPLDVWAPSVPLPRLRPGDLMAVPDVGAAGPTAGLLAYASPAPPVEVVVDEDDQDNGITHVSRLAVTRYPDGR